MIVSVQYMRAIAALLVVIHHAAWKGEQYSSNPLQWFNVGGAGVDLFFIISGYIMCHTTAERTVRIKDFLKARFVRIFPIYWLLTCVALVVFLFMPDKVNSSGGSTSIINSFLLFPTPSKYLIQNGWTLSYEFYFYFIFSLGLIFSGALKYLIPSIILISLVTVGKLLAGDNYYLKFFTNSLLLEFVMGILIFKLSQYWKFKSLISFSFVTIGVLLIVYVNNLADFGERVICYGLPSFIFFLGMFNLEEKFRGIYQTRFGSFFAKIGDSSYSLYLVHPFILTPVAIILKKLGVNQFGYVFVTLLVIAAVLSGFACHYFLEKPLSRILKTNRSK